MNPQIPKQMQNNGIPPQQNQTMPTMPTMRSYKDLGTPPPTPRHNPSTPNQAQNNDFKSQSFYTHDYCSLDPSLAEPAPSSSTIDRTGFAGAPSCDDTWLRQVGNRRGTHNTAGSPSTLPRLDTRTNQSWRNPSLIQFPLNEPSLGQARSGTIASAFANWNLQANEQQMPALTLNNVQCNARQGGDENLDSVFSSQFHTRTGDLGFHHEADKGTEDAFTTRASAFTSNPQLNNLHNRGQRLSNTLPASAQNPQRPQPGTASGQNFDRSWPTTFNAFRFDAYGPADAFYAPATEPVEAEVPVDRSSVAHRSQHQTHLGNLTRPAESGTNYHRPWISPTADHSFNNTGHTHCESNGQVPNYFARGGWNQQPPTHTNGWNASVTPQSRSRDQPVARPIQEMDPRLALVQVAQTLAARRLQHEHTTSAPFTMAPQTTNEHILSSHASMARLQNRSREITRPSTMQEQQRFHIQDNVDYDGWNRRDYVSASNLAHTLDQLLLDENRRSEQVATRGPTAFEYLHQAPPSGLSLAAPSNVQRLSQQGSSSHFAGVSNTVSQSMTQRRSIISPTRRSSHPIQITQNPDFNENIDPLDMIDDPVLKEFKINPRARRRWELKDLLGHIACFSGDQEGSRFIQHKIENSNSDGRQQVFTELLAEAPKLMMDVFGNYVIQKFFEYGDQNQKRLLADTMRGLMPKLSCQVYACRVVQKAMDHLLMQQQLELIKELEGHVVETVRDQNGNHVIQKVIERTPPQHLDFIFNALVTHFYQLSRNQFGCRVVQRVLDKCGPEVRRHAIREISQGVDSLVGDQYGNYVVQHIIEEGNLYERREMIDLVLNQFVMHCKSKFASNVVERCISYGTSAQRHRVLKELLEFDSHFGETVLANLIKDGFANYVIQKLTDHLDADEFLPFIEFLRGEISKVQSSGTANKYVDNVVEKIRNSVDSLRIPGPMRATNQPDRSGSLGGAAGRSSTASLPRINTSTNMQRQRVLSNGDSARSLMSHDSIYKNSNDCGGSTAADDAGSGSSTISNISTPPLTLDETSPESNPSFTNGSSIASPEPRGSRTDTARTSIQQSSPTSQDHRNRNNGAQYSSPTNPTFRDGNTAGRGPIGKTSGLRRH